MNTERRLVLEGLLRAINLSSGEFALLLARCNSVEVRDRLIAELKSRLGDGFYERDLAEVARGVNLVAVLAAAPEETQAASLMGLELAAYFGDILVIANNNREELRRLAFPAVLWVTDELEAQLRRRAPDLASWAAPVFDFGLDRSELWEILERETAGVLEWAWLPVVPDGVKPELQWAWSEWQSRGEALLPEMEAKIHLGIGMAVVDEVVAAEHLERCCALGSGGLLAAAAHYWLGLRQWWQGRRRRIDYLDCTERAREQLQRAWAGVRRPEVAGLLGEVLVALALVERVPWQVVADFAVEVKSISMVAWAAGLRSEVALARQDWLIGLREAESALAAANPERQGFYQLCRGRSLVGLGRDQEAIACLELARQLVPITVQVNANIQVDPDLHIRILRSLHQAYTHAKDYPEAFAVKCDREIIETQYGLRAFIGAKRLPKEIVSAVAGQTAGFSGRGRDIKELIDRLERQAYRLTVLYGPSGVGKSSLLQSGFVPALKNETIAARSILPVVVDRYEDWQGELSRGLGINGAELPFGVGAISKLRENQECNLLTVLIFDQFEEFFFKHVDVADTPGVILGQRREFYEFLQECLAVEAVRVILSLREDSLHYLLEWERLGKSNDIFNDLLNKEKRRYLGNFQPAEAREAIGELMEPSPYRFEAALVERLVQDLAAADGQVRPIELQVVGAQMLHGGKPVLTLQDYEALGDPAGRGLPYRPQQWLVERWLAQVVQDCGEESGALMQRVLVALTKEPEQRPVKTVAELGREVRWLGMDLPEAERELAVPGDLAFVLQVAIGAGLAVEVPAIPEPKYQLIHDYLVSPIRRQFGVNWEQQFEEERQRRKAADIRAEQALQKNLEESQRSNQRLRRLIVATGTLAVVAGLLGGLALQQKTIADQNAIETKKTADVLVWNGLLDADASTLENQVEAIEQVKKEPARAEILRSDYRRPSRLRPAVNVFREQNSFNIQSGVNTIAFAPDGQSILTGSDDKTAKLWSRDGKILQTFSGHQDRVNTIAFAPDGQSILTGSGDKTVKLWSRDGKILQTFSGHQDRVNTIAFAPDGQSILTGSGDETAKLWSRDGKILQTFSGHQSAVNSVAFSPDGQSILTGSGDETAKLWSRDGKILQTFSGHQDRVMSVAFSPDGQSILTSSDDKTAKLWSRDGKILQTFSGHQYGVGSVAFSPDGQSILTGSNDNTVKLWSRDGKILQTFSGHQSIVWSVAFAPDGQSILTGSDDKTAKLWSRDGKILQTFSGHQDRVWSVAFAPADQSILTGGWDRTAKLWSRDGKILQTFSGHQNRVMSVAFSPDSQSILTSSDDKTAKLWSRDGKILQTFSGHQNRVMSVAFSPDGQSILTGSDDKTAKLWSRDGKILQTFSGHQNRVWSVAFAPDGQSILTGSDDKTVKLWSRDGKILQTFSGHQSAVNSVAFALDSQSILTGSDDKTAKLWSRNGKILQTFSGHQSAVNSVAFAPDGRSILTGSDDDTAQMWYIDLDFSLARSCGYLQAFITGNSESPANSDLEKLRSRAKRACQNIPPPPKPRTTIPQPKNP